VFILVEAHASDVLVPRSLLERDGNMGHVGYLSTKDSVQRLHDLL